MKNKRLKVAIVISPDIQDKFIASHIVEKFNVVGIFIEPQYKNEGLNNTKGKLFKKLSEMHFNPVSLVKLLSDRMYYRNYQKRVSDIFMKNFHEKGQVIDSYQDCPVYHTQYRDVSSAENVELLRKLGADVVAVCGCSILKKNFLEVAPLGTINLHSGLAPYYRGCSCYFWPLYNEEPEYAGITIHYVNPGIDDGDIIHQGRPDIKLDDDEISIFVKMMRVGAQSMVQSLSEIEDGTVKGHKQTEKGKLYLDTMTTIRHFRELHKKLRNGLIREYLTKQSNNSTGPIIIE